MGEQQRTKVGIPENVLVDRAGDAGMKVRLTVVFSEAVVVKDHAPARRQEFATPVEVGQSLVVRVVAVNEDQRRDFTPEYPRCGFRRVANLHQPILLADLPQCDANLTVIVGLIPMRIDGNE